MASFSKGQLLISIEHITETEILGEKYFVTMDNGFTFEVTEEEYNEINEQLGA